jgi:hypothetical protein
LVVVRGRRLRGRVSDLPVVDRPLIDASLHISAIVAHKVSLCVPLCRDAVLCLCQRWTAAGNYADDRQSQYHRVSHLAAEAAVSGIGYLGAGQTKSDGACQPIRAGMMKSVKLQRNPGISAPDLFNSIFQPAGDG